MSVSPAAAEILKARAVALARETGSEKPVPHLDAIQFYVGSAAYAVEARFVREVHAVKDLTPLPGTPTFISGILNIRGHILSVIDLNRFLGFSAEDTVSAHILHIHAGDAQVGLQADRVSGVCSIPLQALQSMAPAAAGFSDEFLKGVTSHGAAVLDVDKLLSAEKLTGRVADK